MMWMMYWYCGRLLVSPKRWMMVTNDERGCNSTCIDGMAADAHDLKEVDQG